MSSRAKIYWLRTFVYKAYTRGPDCCLEARPASSGALCDSLNYNETLRNNNPINRTNIYSNFVCMQCICTFVYFNPSICLDLSNACYKTIFRIVRKSPLKQSDITYLHRLYLNVLNIIHDASQTRDH